MVCRVCNLGYILKSFFHHAGVENTMFVGSKFETLGPSGGIYKEILLVLYIVRISKYSSLRTFTFVFSGIPLSEWRRRE